jgi:hypothetical protein
MAAVFALAEKVEKDRGLTAPDVSVRGEAPPARPGIATPPAPAPAPKPAPAKKEKFVIEEDEGC